MKNLSSIEKIIFFLNSLFVLLLTVAVLATYIPTNVFPSISTISLVVQFLVMFNLIFFIFWLLRKRRQFLVSGLILILWYIFSGPFYRFSDKSSAVDHDSSFSIMTFNARNFNESKQMEVDDIDSLIYEFISEQNPDVICFQETQYAMKRNNALSQYKHKFVDFVYGEHRGKVIQSIYSKFPFVKIDSISFPQSANNAIYADILLGKDTVRFYNIHLQSFRIVPSLSTIKNEESSRLFSKSKRVMLKQYEQANLIRENMATTSLKKILVGDFNNTQYSNIYRTIKGDMKDSYIEKGSGFGMTYNLFGFPLRIDYILADPAFEILSHTNYKVKLSDHYPVMATLRLTSKQ